jgi:hypothetical protein
VLFVASWLKIHFGQSPNLEMNHEGREENLFKTLRALRGFVVKNSLRTNPQLGNEPRSHEGHEEKPF